jgi:hypothetical protein
MHASHYTVGGMLTPVAWWKPYEGQLHLLLSLIDCLLERTSNLSNDAYTAVGCFWLAESH